MTSPSFTALIDHLRKTDATFDAAPLTALAEDMAAGGHERDDPVREIMARLGDRWSALLLLVLATGEYRHAALKRVVSVMSAEKTISQRMLTLRLRALERDGMVDRLILPTVPPAVSYRLTPLGQSLVGKLQGMIQWIKDNDSEIQTARRRFST
ncbi:winged helix-turn-helix transcriptional regulator [Rhizobium paknamense]|uniref:DNA-binding HxlR family transcriptional regulator n=1 Tax=Rhizobium paknamense TaxID=1206817 RepID=A0ABU0IGP3_9HYPH|nr:helix-turn-helix domain-containing protein [Rhizobium paknamense]MDQ0456817.1 DNA-binding HxlR family transcriptional regulator [Rhizobium paknamense]